MMKQAESTNKVGKTLEEEQSELERGEKTGEAALVTKGNGQFGLFGLFGWIVVVVCVLSAGVLVFVAVRAFAKDEGKSVVETPSLAPTAVQTAVEDRGYDWYVEVCSTISSAEEAAEIGVELRYPETAKFFVGDVGPLGLEAKGTEESGFFCWVYNSYCNSECTSVDEVCSVIYARRTDFSNMTVTDFNNDFSNVTLSVESCCANVEVLDEVYQWIDSGTRDVSSIMQEFCPV
eukprot:Nitzschia sp. Nitz4//scaffold164_size50480//2655//3353//NITZ4_006997-RA/size50480-processed-gene-0.62-mRNA-1//1//CDS//3329538059//3396//frame0